MGSSVGHTEQATILTFVANTLLTRPNTPFCSCTMRGRRKSHAAAIAGIAGYPPKPTTTVGLSARKLRHALKDPAAIRGNTINLARSPPRAVVADLTTSRVTASGKPPA